jgi:hypothetical protein
MGKTYVVVGAGFRGFCDTLELLKRPGNKIHIIDSAPFFGGVMYSMDACGFAVDKGVHVFDSIPKPLAEVVNEIMDGKTKEIDFISSSAFNGIVTEGFSLPDLSSLSEELKGKIALELITLASSENRKEPKSLADLLELRYGKTAGGIFSKIFKKVYGVGAEEVESNAIAQTSLGRLKFLDDPEMLVLKSQKWLDTVLAARRKTLGKVDDYVSIYPDTGEGMRGWCKLAFSWLEAKGVNINLGESITSIKENSKGVEVITDKQTLQADQVIWANDNTKALGKALGIEDNVGKHQYATPLLFYTFVTNAKDIKDFTYLQNFDLDGFTYRTAAAGIFGNQIRPDGTSFITSECPVVIGSTAWENPTGQVSAAWEECKLLGIVNPNAELKDANAIRIPVSFKLAKLGYSDRIAELNEMVAKKNSRVILRNVIPFFRRDIYFDSLNLLNLV